MSSKYKKKAAWSEKGNKLVIYSNQKKQNSLKDMQICKKKKHIQLQFTIF